MRINLEKCLLSLVVLQIFGQFAQVESRWIKRRGKGKSFGTGMLVGGLAGAAVGKLLSRKVKPQAIHHHHHHMVISPPISSNPAIIHPILSPPKPTNQATIIKVEILPNGCNKQTVREQVDVTRFIETERLVCPQTNLANSKFAHLAPVVTTPPTALVSIIAGPPPPPPPQVIILSKNTGFYVKDKKKRKNAATGLFGNNIAVILSVLVVSTLL